MKPFPMKIALVWPLITSGESSEYYNVQAFGLAGALADRGAVVAIFTAARGQKDKTRHAERCEKILNFHVHYLPARPASLRYPVMPSLFRSLLRFSPDLIQCAEILSPTTYMGFLAAGILKKPFFIYQGTYQWPARLTQAMGLLGPLLVRPVLKHCAGVFTKSDQAKAFVVRSGGRTEKVHTVHLGFDSRPFYPSMSTFLNDICCIPKDRAILLCVGRLVPAKNHAAIIRAVEKIKVTRPDVLLVILGNGPLRKKLDACIKAADLENHVKIIDIKTRQTDMHLVYSSARLFLSPSRYEIFGMTVLEAMACGLPVIGSSVGGMKDIISHGKNGLLVDPESEDEISEAVLLLLNTPSLYHSISGNGIQTSRGFSWDKVAKKMDLFYKNS